MRLLAVSLATTLSLAIVIAPVQAAPGADPTIPAAIESTYSGKNLRIVKDLGTSAGYTRHSIRYQSNGLTISGIMNKPKGKGPFPVVVLAHGYIDPEVYVSGQGFRREQDWLARNGYVALHVDYRNHAASDDDADNGLAMRIGYAADVINAGLAVRESELPFIDNNNVALLGRSMGGGVTYQTLTIKPGVFDAAITYASTSTIAADNFNKWQRNDYPISKEVLAAYGEPKRNPDVWQDMSSRYFFSRITEPVLAFHGTKDESCDIEWARGTHRALQRAGVDATLVEYPGAGHYFYGPWNDSIKKVGAFLRTHLDNPAA